MHSYFAKIKLRDLSIMYAIDKINNHCSYVHTYIHLKFLLYMQYIQSVKSFVKNYMCFAPKSKIQLHNWLVI